MRAHPFLPLPLLLACLESGKGDEGHSAMEIRAAEAINEHRAEHGLAPLELDAEVSAIAREHSAHMADGSVPFSHDGFDARADAVIDLRPETLSVGENVAVNEGFEDPVATAVQGWLDSEPHHENIDGDFNLTGMGIVELESNPGETYFTQLFVLDASL
jgi:uncharacterized protein YkwD